MQETQFSENADFRTALTRYSITDDGKILFLREDEGEFIFDRTFFHKPEVVLFGDTDLHRWSFVGTNIEKVVFWGEEWSKYKRRFRTYKKLKSITNKDALIKRWLSRRGRKVIYDEILAMEPRLCLKDYLKEILFGASMEKKRTWDEVSEVYRKLRKNYEGRLAYEAAGDFHYGQMECRRRDPTRPLWDHITTQIYKTISSYGESFFRPLFWLFTTILCFSGWFLIHGIPLKVDKIFKFNWCSPLKMFSDGFWNWFNDFWMGIKYSISSAFSLRPPTDFTDTLTVISSIERLLVIVFITFFVIALRRRFRR